MSRAASGAGGKLFLVLFSIPFAGVGVFMLCLAVQIVLQSQRAGSWVETPCEILSVALNSSRGSDSTTYKCVARYAYTYNGRTFESDRVSFSKGADNIGSFQQDCCRRIKRDKKAGANSCFVNPEFPYEAVLFRSVRWGMIGFYMIFVLTFGGAGFGMLFFGLFGATVKKKEAAERLKYPDQPWMWKREWHEGAIKASDKTGMIVALCFMLFWNAISFPVGIMAFFEGYLKEGEKGALVALIFPFVGIFLIAWSVYAVLKYIKYGTASLQLASVPGVIGGKLAGVIHVPVHVEPEDGFHVRLACIHRYVTGSGKHRTTHTDVMWEDTRQLSSELLVTDHSQTALPVLFAVPYDARPSTPDVGRDGIIWQVEAKAKTRGIDFSTQFDVPVFKTEESSLDYLLDDSSVRQYEKVRSPDSLLQRLKLSTEATLNGVVYRFPAARHKGSAFGLTVFFAIWTGAVVVMCKVGAPMLFPIVFGLVDLFVFWGVVDQWLVSSRVEITHRVVNISRGIFGIATPKMIHRKDVKGVEIAQGMQSGKTVYYSIKLVTDEGKRLLLGNYVVGRKDAESLAARLQSEILDAE